MKVFVRLTLAGVFALGPIAAAGSGQRVSLAMGLCNVHTAELDTGDYHSGQFSVPSRVVLNCPTRDVTADRATGNFNRKFISLVGHVVAHDAQGAAGFTDFNGVGKSGTQGPSTLTADQFDVDSMSKVYTAIGNVHYLQGNRTIDAARGTLDDNAKLLTLSQVHFVQGTQTVDATRGVLNSNTHDLDLTGSVHIVDGERTMNSDHVLYNTASGALRAKGNVTMTFPGQVEGAPSPRATPKKKKRLLPF
ncbi:MAG: hypothetical protein DLM50_04640 [Candidatus Meridianibacter frigidus]|nr:MAG: hypothetical protein DLM50_04640 [Candidatus Eremiobacteraeota bacterium]